MSFRLALVLAACLLCSPLLARAQDTLTRDIGPSSWIIGGDDIRAMTDILKLTPEQAATAKELLRGARANLQLLERRMQRRGAAYQGLLWDQDDKGKAARKTYAALQGAYADDCEKVEREFLADVKAQLEPEQAEAWPAFERARRRVLLMWLGSEGAGGDLTRVLRQMDLTSEEREALAPTLARYETELDAVVTEHRAVLREQTPWIDRFERHQEPDPDLEAKQKQVQDRFNAVQKTYAQMFAGRLGGVRGEEVLGSISGNRRWFGTLTEDWRFRELTRLKGVTDEQKAQIRRALARGDADFRRQAADFFVLADKQVAGEAVDAEAFERQTAETQALFHDVRTRVYEKLLAILTPEQRAGYEDGTDEAKGPDDDEAGMEGWWW